MIMLITAPEPFNSVDAMFSVAQSSISHRKQSIYHIFFIVNTIKEQLKQL